MQWYNLFYFRGTIKDQYIWGNRHYVLRYSLTKFCNISLLGANTPYFHITVMTG